MEFIRQNLFIVVLAVVSLVAAGTLMGLNYTASGQVEQELKERQAISGQIRSFNGVPINKKYLQDLQARVVELEKIAQVVAQEHRQANQKGYSVIELTANIEGKTQKVPAFPVEKQYAQAGDLYWKFIESYIAELRALRESLSPVTMFKPEEITLEIRNWTQLLEQERSQDEMLRKKQEAEKASTAPAGNSPTQSPNYDVGPMGGMNPMGSMGYGGGGGLTGMGTPDINARANSLAMRQMMVRQASSGAMFVAPDAFDQVFNEPVTSGPFSRLWEAQINLWVQKDVLNAISETNRQALTAARMRNPAAKAEVLNSAIKRVVKIAVDEQYFTNVSNTGPSSASPSTGSPGGGSMGPMGPMGSMGPMGPMGGGAAPSSFGGTPNVAGGSSLGMTHHVCTKDYDVIQYRFTVIMPSRYIPLLEMNLMRQNHHTILKIDIGQQQPEQVVANANNIQVPYYYGPDSVVEVTFSGELLLLTSWERGTFDSVENKWTSPPLVPVEILQGLQNAPNVLRPEDIRRLKK